MATLNIDSFIAATAAIFLSTGDQVTRKMVLGWMTDAGIDAKVASKVWTMLVKSGRVQKGLVVDVTDAFFAPDTVEIVRSMLLCLKADGGLTLPLVNALHVVTGLSTNTLQAALNALEVEYFLEQRRAVAPWQYIPRKWAA